MSTNDSTTGGYLVPQPRPYPNPLEGEKLQDFLQGVLVGVTGLLGKMVRPRWQPVPVNIPPQGTDWIAFGITNRPAETYAYNGHEVPRLDEGRSLDETTDALDDDEDLDTGNNLDNANTFLDEPPYDYIMRNEVLEILCSVYGSGADELASRIREGLAHPQNREVLQLNNMGLVDVGSPLAVPELVNEIWYYRLDMTINIRRRVVRTYPVRNILSATGQLITDVSSLTRDLIINPPPNEE